MRFVIITGFSGSGKTNALKYMEDMGFFCVDNLPPVLLEKFADLCFQGNISIDKVAVVMDIRGREFFSGLLDALKYMDNNEYVFELLFLYAEEEELVNRYNFSRRAHPLAIGGRLLDGIRREKEMLSDIKARATYNVDTTHIQPKQLGEVLLRIFGNASEVKKVTLTLLSFGYKRGVPADSDMVFDVRFMPNPYNVAELRKHSGLTDKVKDYIFSYEESMEFLNKLYELVAFMLPLYIRSGKRELVVAVGCTGGMHRSVATVEWLAARFRENGRPVYVEHRDLQNEMIDIKYKPVE